MTGRPPALRALKLLPWSSEGFLAASVTGSEDGWSGVEKWRENPSMSDRGEGGVKLQLKDRAYLWMKHCALHSRVAVALLLWLPARSPNCKKVGIRGAAWWTSPGPWVSSGGWRPQISWSRRRSC